MFHIRHPSIHQSLNELLNVLYISVSIGTYCRNSFSFLFFNYQFLWFLFLLKLSHLPTFRKMYFIHGKLIIIV